MASDAELCCNCWKEIPCKCAKPETVHNSHGVVCPHCGRLHRPENEDWVLCNEHLEEYECSNSECQKTFRIRAELSWSWKSWSLKEGGDDGCNDDGCGEEEGSDDESQGQEPV